MARRGKINGSGYYEPIKCNDLAGRPCMLIFLTFSYVPRVLVDPTLLCTDHSNIFGSSKDQIDLPIMIQTGWFGRGRKLRIAITVACQMVSTKFQISAINSSLFGFYNP